MRRRRRLAAAAFLFAGALLLGVPAAAPAAPAPPARVGVLLENWSPTGDEILESLRAALASASLVVDGREGVELIERTSGSGEADLRAGFAELSLEGVQVVAALGAGAARLAPESVRDRAVVIVSPAPTAAGGDRVRAIATTPDPADVAREIRRIAPRASRTAVAGPLGGTADALVTALSALARTGTLVDRMPWPAAGPEAEASVASELDVAELVLVSPETDVAGMADLARRMATKGAALVGSRADHLSAGAAVVLRPSLKDVGGLVAASVADALAGGSGPRLRRPRRLLREVHLGNARRLGFEVPLSVLAASDRTVAAPPASTVRR
jgi:hypothetical protein